MFASVRLAVRRRWTIPRGISWGVLVIHVKEEGKRVTFDRVEYGRIKGKYADLMAERRVVERELAEERERKAALDVRHADAKDGAVVVQRVAKMTQDRLGDRVGALVSMAEAAVFPDPYRFALQFVPRRGKTEADPVFIKSGKTLDPMSTSGGGPKDVASFFARPAAWSLRKDRRRLIFSDEGFKFLHSPEYQRNCSDVLRAVARELDMQMVIVTDQADLAGDVVIEL